MSEPRDARCATGSGAEPALAAGDLEAGGESLHIPLPRPGRGLVKVVDIEHEAPLRRAKDPEVRKVRVATELHVQPRDRRRGKIRRHRQRGAAEVRKRRQQHSTVPNRDQFPNPALGLALEQLDRITSASGRLPPCVRRTGNRLTSALPAGDPFGGRAVTPTIRRNRLTRPAGMARGDGGGHLTVLLSHAHSRSHSIPHRARPRISRTLAEVDLSPGKGICCAIWANCGTPSPLARS